MRTVPSILYPEIYFSWIFLSRRRKDTEEVSNNTSIRGGGVWFDRNSTFEMSGGKIINNISGNGGGLVVWGNFYMSGGSIIGNTASGVGGCMVLEYGVFTMTGGTIAGNTANSGGAIYMGTGNPTFRLVTGIIYGSDEDSDLANNATSAAALYSSGTAQYGYFDGETWVSNGNLVTTNDTIKAVDGNLQ